jgi:hypothetical protein
MVVGVFEGRRPTEREQKLLVKMFREKFMSNVVVTRDRISGDYDGRRLSYPVREVKHVKNVGNWEHCLSDDTIVLDDGVKPSERAGVLVHEAVEQYLMKEYGLPYGRADFLATLAERHYVGVVRRARGIGVFKTGV